MSDIEQQLQKLEDRFVDGDISEATFKELRERLLARQAGGSGSDNGQGVNIADSVVRGDIHQTTSHASGANVGGGIHVNLGAGALHHESRAEMEYEDFVLAILEGGGVLTAARQILDERRRRLGLGLRVSGEIEAACLRQRGSPDGAGGKLDSANEDEMTQVARDYVAAMYTVECNSKEAKQLTEELAANGVTVLSHLIGLVQHRDVRVRLWAAWALVARFDIAALSHWFSEADADGHHLKCLKAAKPGLTGLGVYPQYIEMVEHISAAVGSKG